MPASATSSSPHLPEDLIGRLKSPHTPQELKLKSLRDLKNLIIGNRTKKLAFLKLGAVPLVVEILSNACVANCEDNCSASEINVGVLIQCGAVLGSFACGLDAGVRAVLDAGALNLLLGLIFHRNQKVSDAAARSLKLIYQSKLAPKYDFLQQESVDFLRSLLSSKNENVSSLGASIITHSCRTTEEQNLLSETGFMKRLISLLGGSLTQRDASLESMSALIKENSDVALKFMGPENGRALNVIIELLNDKNNRTRLLACTCLICIRNASTSYLQDPGTKNKLVLILLDLLNDPGPVGNEAPFALSNLVSGKEDMQKTAFDVNVVDRLCELLKAVLIQPKRLQGILLALSELCSTLECCRDRVLDLEVLNLVTEALAHDSIEVRGAACTLLKNLSRSVKNLSAGQFMNDVVSRLVLLLSDSSSSVQIAALRAISNIAVDFMSDKFFFMECGCVKQLVQLSKSMESSIRLGSMWALKNLMFLVNNRCKEEILFELSSSMLSSLLCDPEASVQEQALAMVRNLVDGPLSSIEYVFQEDELILRTVGRQLRSASNVEVLIQVMYTLCNVASGNERHKEAVMGQIFPCNDNSAEESLIIKLLQSSDSRLRVATVWTLINLTLSSSPHAQDRATRLHNAGVVSQLKNMVNDPCVDVKLRARTALSQLMMFGDAATQHQNISI